MIRLLWISENGKYKVLARHFEGDAVHWLATGSINQMGIIEL
ncbi:hypothetical protein [Cytobacillus depressus]|nr:hypothetical protein [Cytobacillus depressus]